MHQGESQIALSQKPYAVHILENFKMVDCPPTKTPIEAQLKLTKEGGRSLDATLYISLRYLLPMRPNLTNSVSILSRYMMNPTFDH